MKSINQIPTLGAQCGGDDSDEGLSLFVSNSLAGVLDLVSLFACEMVNCYNEGGLWHAETKSLGAK